MDDLVCVTLDVDWAPDEAIANAMSALDERGLRATVFATHDSPVLRSIAAAGVHEVALHPNFNDAGGEYEPRLRALKDLYPDAVGGRSHALYVSARIFALYREHGLRYESNAFLPWHPNLRPVSGFGGLVSIPIYWADDLHVALRRPFTLDALGVAEKGLKVLIFHPVRIFMNNDSDEHYVRMKPAYHDADALRAGRADRGVGDLFRELLDHLAADGGGRTTLAELAG
jgi:hypothetical protein